MTLAGNLTDPKGNPLPITPLQLTLEASTDSGQSWQAITVVTVTPNGAYNYTWAPDAGSYLVRAHYLGTAGGYEEAYSTPLPLDVTRTNETMTLTSSPATPAVDANATITVTMSPFISGANVTLSYTTDNKTFTPIQSIIMTSPTMSIVWKATVPGTFMLVATYAGDVDHNTATAYFTIHR